MTKAGQGPIVWLTGLPGAGKTTIASELVTALRNRGIGVLWLDSDELRTALFPGLGYSDSERDQFYDTIIFLGKLAAAGGVCTVISATASKRRYRDKLRQQSPNFFEVWVQCSPEILQQRDPKGLYKKSKKGDVTKLPGLGTAYEEPLSAEVVVDSGTRSVEESVALILQRII